MRYILTNTLPPASTAITGSTLAHLKKGSVGMARVLAKIADGRVEFVRPTEQQLGLWGGVSTRAIRRARHTKGNGSSRANGPSSVDRLVKLWGTLSTDERIALAVRLGPDVLLEIASEAEQRVANATSPVIGDLFAA